MKEFVTSSSFVGDTVIRVYEPTRRIKDNVTSNDKVIAQVSKKLFSTHGFTDEELRDYIKPYCANLHLWCEIRKDIIVIKKNGIVALLKKIKDEWKLKIDVFPSVNIKSFLEESLCIMKKGNEPQSIFSNEFIEGTMCL